MSQPIKKLNLGKCQAALWEKEYEGKKMYSVSFQKCYKGKEGWKNTQYFSFSDLPSLLGLISHLVNKQVKEMSAPKKKEDVEFDDAKGIYDKSEDDYFKEDVV